MLGCQTRGVVALDLGNSVWPTDETTGVTFFTFRRTRTTLSRSRLRGRCLLSVVFQSEIVVHGMAEFLLAAEIPFGCLHRCVAKEKLNLLKLSACEMA